MLKTGLELVDRSQENSKPLRAVLMGKKQGSHRALQRQPGGLVPGPTQASHPSCVALSLYC